MSAVLALYLIFPSYLLAADLVGKDPTTAFLKGNPKRSIALEDLHIGLRAVGDIPALTEPRFWSAAEADRELEGDEMVMGLVFGEDARAYPVRVLNHHEIVNDVIADKPFAVTYCPLCLSGIAFERTIASKTLTFGVSGLLYNSDLVFYDQETATLWSQILGEAILGPLTGTRLKRLPLRYSRWRDWKAAHPETRVLSFDTGFGRNYHRIPYKRYHSRQSLMFPVRHRDSRLPNKQVVFGLQLAGKTKAYPLAFLSETTINDELGGVALEIKLGRTGPRAWRKDTHEEVTGTVAYWFAWAAFHPDTKIGGMRGSE